MTETTRPVGIALVLCDNVYTESHGKQALVGLFSKIATPTFPAVHPRMCVFVTITDIRPNTRCRLDIVHGETDDPVFAASGPAPIEFGPTAICDLVFEIEGVVFNEPGTYYVRLFGNDHILMQRPFEVSQITPPGGIQDENNAGDKHES